MNGAAKSLQAQRVSPYLLRRRRSLEEARAEVESTDERGAPETEDSRERIGNRAFHG